MADNDSNSDNENEYDEIVNQVENTAEMDAKLADAIVYMNSLARNALLDLINITVPELEISNLKTHIGSAKCTIDFNEIYSRYPLKNATNPTDLSNATDLVYSIRLGLVPSDHEHSLNALFNKCYDDEMKMRVKHDAVYSMNICISAAQYVYKEIQKQYDCLKQYELKLDVYNNMYLIPSISMRLGLIVENDSV